MATGSRLTFLEISIMLGISLLLIFLSAFKMWSLDLTEVFGFATGGICVWLVVREHMWNWPVGLANNIFFFYLFWHSRLYADMWLQVVYLVMGAYGWVNWLFGGAKRTQLTISRTARWEWILLLFMLPLVTWAFRAILLAVNGAAPFWDSFTTVLSLAAQYLLCRKRFENWFFWIAADLIYVPLYISRHLPLTALLYGCFLVMCVIGVREWSRRQRELTTPANLSAAV